MWRVEAAWDWIDWVCEKTDDVLEWVGEVSINTAGFPGGFGFEPSRYTDQTRCIAKQRRKGER